MYNQLDFAVIFIIGWIIFKLYFLSYFLEKDIFLNLCAKSQNIMYYETEKKYREEKKTKIALNQVYVPKLALKVQNSQK